jgi:hypothetical protein
MIGKKVGRSLYVGYAAVLAGEAGIPLTTRKHIRRGQMQLPPDFRLDLVCLEHTGRIRYIELSNLLDAHPHAGRSFVYCPGPRAKIEPGHCRGQLYHRLDAILGPVHPYYAFFKAITEFEERTGLLGPDQPRGIGSKSVWELWVAKHMSPDEYEAQIDLLTKLIPRED